MKRIVNLLCIISGIITSVLVMCTFLTSYHFLYVGFIFNYYTPIQIGLIITFLLLTLKFIINEHGKKRIVYFIICLSIIFALVYLMNYVK